MNNTSGAHADLDGSLERNSFNTSLAGSCHLTDENTSGAQKIDLKWV